VLYYVPRAVACGVANIYLELSSVYVDKLEWFGGVGGEVAINAEFPEFQGEGDAEQGESLEEEDRLVAP
jgi:hypothetical protein